MIYLKWALLIAPSLFMAVVGRLLAPVLPFFVQEDGYLPSWLSWFQTPDNPADGDEAGHVLPTGRVVLAERRLRLRHLRLGRGSPLDRHARL